MSTLTEATTRTYYQDTYQDKLSTKILESGEDETGFYFVPESTIFHPQGGGQPADTGEVSFDDQSFSVTGLSESSQKIRHYVSKEAFEELSSEKTREVHLSIDIAKRTLFGRLHSAGHLLANVVQELYPQLEGCKGNHFPDVAFVVFKGSPMPDKGELKEKVETRAAEIIQEKRPFIVDNSGDPRQLQIEGLKAYPCGGTHVRDSGEIGAIEIRSVKSKKGELKIGYNIN